MEDSKKIDALQKHLNKFLNEFEAELDNGELKSPEILEEYIEAAKFMKQNFGRVGDRIEDAIETHDELVHGEM